MGCLVQLLTVYPVGCLVQLLTVYSVGCLVQLLTVYPVGCLVQLSTVYPVLLHPLTLCPVERPVHYNQELFHCPLHLIQ